MSYEQWCDITTDRILVSACVNIFIQEKKEHKLSEFHGKLREISEKGYAEYLHFPWWHVLKYFTSSLVINFPTPYMITCFMSTRMNLVFFLVKWLLQNKVCTKPNAIFKLDFLLNETNYLCFVNKSIYFRLWHLSGLKNYLIIFSFFIRRKMGTSAAF